MKEIMRIEGGDDLEKVIQQAKSLHSPRDKKENNERLTLYGFLRKASPLLERPVTLIHGDKPDFILTTPTHRIGLESRLISTPALEHASHLHDSTFGHQCINTTDFLLTK
jgi:hypothetical protein